MFWDPKSSESYAPYYSSGTRDDLIQRRYIEVFLQYWQDASHNPASNVYTGLMVDMNHAHIWCWDARPYPDFPARLDVWSDGGNWQTGHWVNGRTGLVSLADIVSELTISAGSFAPDVDLVHGMVTGYVVDRPMSARAALSPLSQMYQFDLVEQAQGLAFSSKGVQEPTTLNVAKLVRSDNGPVLTVSRQDIEIEPKDVRLHFIEQGRDYQSGTATARNLSAETVRIVDMQAPVVLDGSQAKQIANNLLDQNLVENSALTFVIAPNQLAFEPGDIVTLSGQDGNWQITDLEGLGVRTVQARKSSGQVSQIVSGAEPAAPNSPNWVSPPEGIVLDIASFDENISRQGPLVGAILSPWARTVFTTSNGQEVETSAPIVMGILLSDLGKGPIARADKGPSIDVKLPGVTLSSLTDIDFLEGGNLLAVETASGWEIFQCQNAVLISEHTYRIDTFLRGLYGTGADMDDVVLSGARIVYLGQGFQDLPLNAALRGNHVELGRSKRCPPLQPRV